MVNHHPKGVRVKLGTANAKTNPGDEKVKIYEAFLFSCCCGVST